MNILNPYTTSPVNTKQGMNMSLKSTNSTTKTTIFYTNDIHGQVPKMERLVSAGLDAGINAEKNGADFLKLCSGDTFIGSDEKRNTVAAAFLDIAGFDAETLGNHEFDITANICGNLLKNSKTTILGMNSNFPDNNSELSRKVSRSKIVEGKNGDKYGLIGLQPSDLNQRIKKKENLSGITVDDIEQTKIELTEEIGKLEAQGVNKIVVLSHEGHAVEKEIAQSVSGIDVILGGHSHDLIKDVTPGKNLFYSPKGEPVVITQAGRDGNNFGVLNLEFNATGQITYIQNNVRETNEYKPNLVMSQTTDRILGKSPEIGTLKAVNNKPENIMSGENPWADFVADALKENLDSEIVLINSANFRGSVDTGTVTERDISSIFPFNNKLSKVKIYEPELVAAIKMGATSVATSNHKPGLLQVSGLRYSVSSQGELLDLKFVDKKGDEHLIDINNPDPNKSYVTVYDEFLKGGGDEMTMLKPKEGCIIEQYDFDKDKVTCDKIRTLNQPFEVNTDGRIQVY